MITELRQHFTALIANIIGTNAIVTTTGDLTTVGDAKQPKIRVKMMPREAPSLDTTQKLKQQAGLISIDIFSPRINGPDAAEALANLIVSSVIPGPTLELFGQVHVWNTWSEGMIEEPAYLRVPVFIRWSLLYN